MSSSYEKVRGGKLSFKAGLAPEKTLDKKKKKKKTKTKESDNVEKVEVELEVEGAGAGVKGPVKVGGEKGYDIDTGTGHAPDGKKSKKYEELFPVETKRFGYVVPEVISREAALDERIKKKADRYCK
jgi:hypothetical protein